MRAATLAVLSFAVTIPLAAQGGGGGGGMNMDPTNKIVGTGKLPDGWMVRFDPVRAGQPQPALTDVNFVTMGSGFHFTTGPAGIYYRTSDVATGEYTVSATFGQRKSMGHEAYGLFIGGKNLQDSTQAYLYFVVKPCRSRGDCTNRNEGTPFGEVLINQRTSDGRPFQFLPAATHSDAVNTDDPTDGHATNKLTIQVTRDSVLFMANDKRVHALAKSQLNGMTTDGIAGVRINHNLDVHLGDFSIRK
jgi:hypothetical protein